MSLIFFIQCCFIAKAIKCDLVSFLKNVIFFQFVFTCPHLRDEITVALIEMLKHKSTTLI